MIYSCGNPGLRLALRVWAARGVAIALAFCIAVPLSAQQLEASAPPKGETAPEPYLAGHEMDFALLLGRPPVAGSLSDREDVNDVAAYQDVDAARWQTAVEDARFLYPRFDVAFGRSVNRSTSPAMIRLLSRALQDVSATTFAAKDHFSRPRPYQRNQLHHVCLKDKAPEPEQNPTSGTSYPSGHSSYGWATALILARLAPDRADALFARASEYAESRLICGMHFPSDLTAGKIIATAVVIRLDQDTAFAADLERARKELAGQ